MPIDMMTLEAALAPLEEVGQGETTFQVGTIEVTLRILVPEEELEAQRYAVQVFEDGNEDDRHSVLAYMDRMRLAVLSYAVVAVGGNDFRNEKVVATGEELPNGKQVTVEKHVAIRQLIRKWSRPIVTGMFRKYTELVGNVEKQAESAIEFEPSDIDAEIARLEDRVAELRLEKKKELEEKGPDFNEELRSIAQKDAEQGPEGTYPVESPPQPPPPPPQPEPVAQPQRQPAAQQPPPQYRQGIIPEETAPPVEMPPSSQPQRQPAAQQMRPPMDSFVDSGDQEAMDRAIAAENQRLLEMRRRQHASQMPPQGAAPQGPSSPLAPPQRGIRREAPHAQAAQVAEEFSEEEAALFAATQARHRGTVGGVDAYQIGETQELADVKVDQDPTRGAVTVNSSPDMAQSRNPRFQPPSKGFQP
jgi:hypothetical protein